MAASASEAARQATRKLAGRGIVTIDYASGIDANWEQLYGAT